MEGQTQNNTITLRGLLVPTHWDEQGHAVGFALSGFDEQVYQLDDPQGLRELKELLRKVVLVRGTLTRASDGSQVLRVKNCELTQGVIDDEKKTVRFGFCS